MNDKVFPLPPYLPEFQGLTKRELIAAMVLAGLHANLEYNHAHEMFEKSVIDRTIKSTDALIRALSGPKGE